MSMLEQILPCNLNKPYIFISYSSKDRERVLEDVLEFQRRGYNVWLDDLNLDKTNPSWKVDALKAIESYYCQLVVFYVSRWSLTSDNCYEELCHTRHEDTIAYHNEEVKYIAVELESIGNIVSYKNRVFDELMEDETVSLKERQDRAKVLHNFIRDFFNTNNEKVRVHPRDEANRKMDYYTDVTAAFPDKTRILTGMPADPTKKPVNTVTSVPGIQTETYTEKSSVEKWYAEAQGYYELGEYSRAIQIWKRFAEQGVAHAQYKLGMCYRTGRGINRNSKEAAKWYHKAAEQGDAGAQYYLGLCYDEGTGVPQDYNEAVKWYHKAAEQGHADAQFKLGWCYSGGYGVLQDYSEGIKWYRKAAEQGNVYAQYSLGVFYHYGRDVPQNYDEAVKWYRKAAEQGDASAQCHLGWCYEKGYRNYDEAVKWFLKAAEQGNADAQYKMGWCCQKGYGVPQDYAEAVMWYKKAAEQGNTSAKSALTREELKPYL